MEHSRAVTGLLLVALVVGGVVHWQKRETTADFAAGEACRIYRLVQQPAMSRNVDPGQIDILDDGLERAYLSADSAASQDSKYGTLRMALNEFTGAAGTWLTLHDLRTGHVDHADLPAAEQAYGAAESRKRDVDAACDAAPFHANDAT